MARTKMNASKIANKKGSAIRKAEITAKKKQATGLLSSKSVLGSVASVEIAEFEEEDAPQEDQDVEDISKAVVVEQKKPHFGEHEVFQSFI